MWCAQRDMLQRVKGSDPTNSGKNIKVYAYRFCSATFQIVVCLHCTPIVNVGEDSILLRSTTYQNRGSPGEFA